MVPCRSIASAPAVLRLQRAETAYALVPITLRFAPRPSLSGLRELPQQYCGRARTVLGLALINILAAKNWFRLPSSSAVRQLSDPAAAWFPIAIGMRLGRAQGGP